MIAKLILIKKVPLTVCCLLCCLGNNLMVIHTIHINTDLGFYFLKGTLKCELLLNLKQNKALNFDLEHF